MIKTLRPAAFPKEEVAGRFYHYAMTAAVRQTVGRLVPSSWR